MAAATLSEGKPTPAKLRVGGWQVDSARNEVSRGTESVRLEPKVIEVLAQLASRPGEVISRDELLAAVWPGVVVGDDALTQAIIKLRKALGDDAHKPTYIETISKRGYRLIAPVEVLTLRAGKRMPIAAAALLLLAGLGAAVALLVGPVRMPWPLAPDTRGASGGSMPIVAILPLANLSGDPKRDYFSDGITEDIINGLGLFSGLRVMSMSAVQEFKEKSASLQALRSQLGARYIVKGSVREADRRLRVVVELSDADRGVQLWSDHYDGENAQLFEFQDRIVRSLVSALQVRLTELEARRTFSKPTESLEAHDLVLRARALLYPLDRRANREARVLLARARELAPEYGEVLTAQGEAEMQRALYGWVEDAPESMRRAEQLAKQALANPDVRFHSRAHSLLSSVYSNVGRLDDCARHADLALAANPSDATALYRKAAALVFTGRVDESIIAFEAARRIYPNSGNAGNFAFAYYVAGRYADALALVDTMLVTFPNDVTLRAIRTATLSQLGKGQEARLSAEDVRRLSPGFRVANFAMRFTDAQHRAKVHEGLFKAGMQ